MKLYALLYNTLDKYFSFFFQSLIFVVVTVLEEEWFNQGWVMYAYKHVEQGVIGKRKMALLNSISYRSKTL